MQQKIDEIRLNLTLINDIKEKYGLEKNLDSCGPLLYTAIASPDHIEGLSHLVEKYFGPPHKPAGESAFFKNLFNGFARSVGGMNKNQTYYRRDISHDMTLYCAFWPWGSNPEKISVRIELLYNGKGSLEYLEEELSESFS